MKRLVDLYFILGSVSHKPSCQIVDPASGETLAYTTREGWEEAERSAIKEAEKHVRAGPVPANKTVEIEVPDPEPVELTEVVDAAS